MPDKRYLFGSFEFRYILNYNNDENPLTLVIKRIEFRIDRIMYALLQFQNIQFR